MSASLKNKPDVPFAFAGLMTRIPRSWRLLRIDGNGDAGRFILGDEQGVRLETNWTFNSHRRFKPDVFARKRLGRKLAEPFNLPGWTGAHHAADAKTGVERYIACHPQTHRVVEWRHHPQGDGADRRFVEQTLATFCDQPRSAPYRWAFFDLRFTTPADFVWREATLNLGDMKVDLSGPRRSVMTIRHIYPATLALHRRPLETWRQTLLEDADALYKPVSATDARLRFVPGLIRWRLPRHCRAVLVHDPDRDRLLWVRAAAAKDRLEDLIQTAVDGVNWSD